MKYTEFLLQLEDIKDVYITNIIDGLGMTYKVEYLTNTNIKFEGRTLVLDRELELIDCKEQFNNTQEYYWNYRIDNKSIVTSYIYKKKTRRYKEKYSYEKE